MEYTGDSGAREAACYIGLVMAEARSPRRAEDFLHLDYRAPGWEWKRNQRALFHSALLHSGFAFTLALSFLWSPPIEVPETIPIELPLRFPNLRGAGSGGGGGRGDEGQEPTAAARERPQLQTDEKPEPRRAPIAPRPPSQLRADSLKVPELPNEMSAYFDPQYSPDAQEFSGLSLEDAVDYGGLDLQPSAGTKGGFGGGTGTGRGVGSGRGVGPGEGGGYGGGRPGTPDTDPIAIYDPEPGYPPLASEKQIRGEVILEILVHADGSTEVLRVLKSLPYGCVEAAIAAARRWRFKPALKDGEPVDALGIITVEFSLSLRKTKLSPTVIIVLEGPDHSTVGGMGFLHPAQDAADSSRSSLAPLDSYTNHREPYNLFLSHRIRR